MNVKIMEFIVLDNQPFSVVDDVGFRRLVEHLEPWYTLSSRRYFSDVALPELHINSITAISFTTYILCNAVWVFACPKRYSNTVKAVHKILQTSKPRTRTMCLQ